MGGIGWFPGEANPMVVYHGFDGRWQVALHGIRNQIEQIMVEQQHFPAEERAFVPHITLARIRNPLSDWQRGVIAGVVDKYQAIAPPPVCWVSSVRMYESVRDEYGRVRYDTVAEIPLLTGLDERLGVPDEHGL